MAQAWTTIGAVGLAAYLICMVALGALRRQERRKVYGDFMGTYAIAVTTLQEALGYPLETPLNRVDPWKDAKKQYRAIENAWAHLVLVAPQHITAITAAMTSDLERLLVNCDGLNVEDLFARYADFSTQWEDSARGLVSVIRRDLKVDSWLTRRRTARRGDPVPGAHPASDVG